MEPISAMHKIDAKGVRRVMSDMKNGNASGPFGVVLEMLYAVGIPV